MKDWKFIKVGNSYTKGQVLAEVNGRKYVFGGEINGTYLVHIQPSGRTFSFSSEQEIKDWLRNSKLGNKKVGNESIDKQEWSMFNGLTKDAEKEIGNETPDEMEVNYKGYTITYFPYQKKYMVRHPNEVSGLIQKHFASVDEAKKSIDKKIGNRVCNESVKENNISGKNGSGVITRMNNLYFAAYNLSNGEKGIEKFTTESQAKDFLKKKVGNEETKAERKFGKVMGEFEEGSLKTPQGKTVTDPAQAKAIAYSEADKVDNLKRARNAMNKKVKNSSVREYKDSQGRIAQIDFNSDGTDADMAIYEDEKMSKSVEQRNFSTIRDAEQYVQSHGFRRVG